MSDPVPDEEVTNMLTQQEIEELGVHVQRVLAASQYAEKVFARMMKGRVLEPRVMLFGAATTLAVEYFRPNEISGDMTLDHSTRLKRLLEDIDELLEAGDGNEEESC